MASTFSIFDHFAHPRASLDVPTTPRSWVINNYGECDFSIATTHPDCTERNLQYGNMVFVEHIPQLDETNTAKGKLPDWVGFIFTPRTWGLGVVHCKAYSAEALLAYRPMPYVNVSNKSPREMFSKIIEYANQIPLTIGQLPPMNIKFKLGIVEDLPETFSDIFRLSAFDHIQNLCKNAGMDWDVTGKINANGDLDLYANLYRRQGVDTNLELNNDNTEAGDPLLSEQGNPSNVVIGHSQANTSQERTTQIAIHQGSLNDYGFFGINQNYMGIKDTSGTQNAAQARVEERGRPRRTLQKIKVLDHRNTFSFLRKGNTATRHDSTVGFLPGGGFGFDTRARMLSIDYNDLSNNCATNLELLE